MEEQFLLYAYTIGPAVSVTAGIFMIVVCLSVKKMMKHPGSMILVQTIFMMIFDLEWLTGVPEILEKLIRNGWCHTFGFIGVYAYFSTWGYITALSIEIMLMIKYPVNKNYRTRLIIAHITIAIFAGMATLLTEVLGSSGRSMLGCCFVEIDSTAEYYIYRYLSYVPLLFNTPIIAYCMITSFMSSLKLGRMILYNHCLIVVLFWISRIGGVVIYVFKKEALDIFAVKAVRFR
jgi:hypothetical protein